LVYCGPGNSRTETLISDPVFLKEEEVAVFLLKNASKYQQPLTATPLLRKMPLLYRLIDPLLKTI